MLGQRGSNLQLGADGGSAVVAEVQHGVDARPQTPQHAEVVHQQHRGSPLLLLPDARTGRTGPDKLVETLQADGRIPGDGGREGR